MCRRRLRGHAACLDADGRERVLHLDDEPQGPRLHVLALGEDDDGADRDRRAHPGRCRPHDLLQARALVVDPEVLHVPGLGCADGQEARLGLAPRDRQDGKGADLAAVLREEPPREVDVAPLVERLLARHGVHGLGPELAAAPDQGLCLTIRLLRQLQLQTGTLRRQHGMQDLALRWQLQPRWRGHLRQARLHSKALQPDAAAGRGSSSGRRRAERSRRPRTVGGVKPMTLRAKAPLAGWEPRSGRKG
mmetsp:Transcript_117753/g.313244  ORF Transcript_117753/g.313244 Transcript_117753/m.313244 type:complete len:248 (+) Transcript_117753:148-891(+)